MVSEAILIDWELMEPTSHEEPRNHLLTGTWQHIATNSLQRRGDPHNVMHDIESTLWVILMVELRGLSHNSGSHKRETLNTIISRLFYNLKMLEDPRLKHRDMPFGASDKTAEITASIWTETITFPGPFFRWFMGVKFLIAPTVLTRRPGVNHEELYKLSPDDLPAYIRLWKEAIAASDNETPLHDRKGPGAAMCSEPENHGLR